MGGEELARARAFTQRTKYILYNQVRVLHPCPMASYGTRTSFNSARAPCCTAQPQVQRIQKTKTKSLVCQDVDQHKVDARAPALFWEWKWHAGNSNT